MEWNIFGKSKELSQISQKEDLWDHFFSKQNQSYQNNMQYGVLKKIGKTQLNRKLGAVTSIYSTVLK